MPAGLYAIELTSDFQRYIWKVYFLNGISTKGYKNPSKGIYSDWLAGVDINCAGIFCRTASSVTLAEL